MERQTRGGWLERCARARAVPAAPGCVTVRRQVRRGVLFVIVCLATGYYYVACRG